MYEEYIFSGIVNAIIGFMGFRYSEFFLQRKYENRKKTLILWIVIYVAFKTVYGNFAENYPFYNRFSYAIPHFILLGALEFFFFEKNTARQAFVIASFIAGWEILRFIASPLAHSLLGMWNYSFEICVNIVMAKGIVSAERLIEAIPTINNVALYITLSVCRGLQIGIFYIYLKLIQKNFVNADYRLNSKECAFLLMPCVAIICVDITLRIMAYSADNSALMLIYDRAPETLTLLPVVSLLLLGFVISSAILFRGLAEGKEEERKRLLLENSVTEMRAQITEIENIYGDMRGLNHDLRGHIASIAAYVRNRGEDIKGISDYLKGMETAVAKLDFTDRTGNPLTDIILHRYRLQAKRKNIEVFFEFHYPQSNIFDIYDISVILNNALQNATEATEKTASPHISLRSYMKGSLFFIEVENNFEQELIWNENSDLPVTAKKEKTLHGLGLENIKRTAQKYSGDIDIGVTNSEKGKIFCLTVMLYRKD